MNEIMAMAYVRGSESFPSVRGLVTFTPMGTGTMVTAAVEGLPEYRPADGGMRPVGPFGFHIHRMGDCAPQGTAEPFTGAGEHWDPDGQPHGNHAGDFPVLISQDGRAWMQFYTDRFRPGDVTGKSVMIHENPDDYTTQPSGGSGRRIACGVIRSAGAPYEVIY